MRSDKLDKIDKKILKILQSNGCITNVELAKTVGISAPPCLRRVRSLEAAGYIKSYHAKINPASVGYGVTVFAMVKLGAHAEDALVKFEDRIRDMPMVRECHMIAGEVDFILKVVAKDWDGYQNFLRTELTPTANIVSIKSQLVMRIDKDDPGVPIDD